MRLHLHTEPAGISLSGTGDLKRLDAVVHGAADPRAAIAPHGMIDADNRHVWIDIAWLRNTAGQAQPADWVAQFEAMVAYAQSKGWGNPERTRLRVHLVPG